MYVVALLGSPSRPSRTARLVDAAIPLLREQGVETVVISVYDFTAEDILYGRFDSPAIKNLQQLVKQSAGLIVATPVYKAAYAGALKLLLDVLPEGALEHKPVLPLVSGGTAAHLLAVDYAVKPVLGALKAQEIHSGVFAVESQLSVSPSGQPVLVPELATRLTKAVASFADNLKTLHPPLPGPNELRDSLVALRVSV